MVVARAMINFGLIELFSIFLVLTNIFTFFLYVSDKQKAAANGRRISEKTLIFFTLAFGGIGAFLGMRLARHKTKHVKFKVAVALGLVFTLISVVHIVHGVTLDRIVRFVEIEFHSESWPSDLDGYRIGLMTDMHTTPHEAMAEVASALNEKNLDLLLLGGDFFMRDGHYRGTLREIAQILTTDGIFGVEGNHDDYRRLFAAKEQFGMTPLDNNGLHIRPGFYLAGVRDLWNRNPDVEAALAGAESGDFVLLVSHNPDVSMKQSTASVDLILSGHTHAGQITFFGIPFYLLRGSISDYGMRFGYGFAYSGDGVPVFTSSGVGDYFSLPRIFARPEVVIFTMRSVPS